MEKAVALSNNDVVFLAWSYEAPIPGCLGFAIRRLEAGGVAVMLPAWVGFHGESNPDWDPRDTGEWPVQKFTWRDLTATWGHTYSYEIVPRVGKPGQLKSEEGRVLRTEEVTLTPICSTNVSAYFNRGILSTQALSHALPKNSKGAPDGAELLEHIKKPGDPIREALAGQIVEGLTQLLKGAVRDDSSCLGALYELNDPELVAGLIDPERVSLVLSEAGEDDGTNEASRKSLHDAEMAITDRLFHTNAHLGHNKFLVKRAASGEPTSILTGSTNWTHTGICGQANNALLLSDGPLATAYRDYWEKLKAECPPAPARATQGSDFRSGNNEAHAFEIDGAKVTLWFSPNTKLQGKPSHDPPAPGDMAQVFELIRGAKEGVLFLLFQPGNPCVLDAIREAQEADPELIVRGAATDAAMISKYEATIYKQGEVPQVAAAAVPDDPIGSMQKELLKTPGAHAIIHDKIVVIDPRSPDCKVITGSHNLGYKASYANDENLLIIEGHRRLAEAYATHVIDVYDHYRWRWHASKHAGHDGADNDPDDGSGLAAEDSWQDEYFGNAEGEAERRFWL
jgi:phosphatidylserine/phosphatidylglycerophosphate/cardiolipin synthase-like enzyme